MRADVRLLCSCSDSEAVAVEGGNLLGSGASALVECATVAEPFETAVSLDSEAACKHKGQIIIDFAADTRCATQVT